MHSVSCKRAICKGDAARARFGVSVIVLFQVWCQAIQGLYDFVELEADIWFCRHCWLFLVASSCSFGPEGMQLLDRPCRHPRLLQR